MAERLGSKWTGSASPEAISAAQKAGQLADLLAGNDPDALEGAI